MRQPFDAEHSLIAATVLIAFSMPTSAEEAFPAKLAGHAILPALMIWVRRVFSTARAGAAVGRITPSCTIGQRNSPSSSRFA